jgi:transposase
MLDALCGGERDPAVLAGLAKASLRSKIPELTLALAGDFRPHHEAMLSELLGHYDDLGKVTARLDQQIGRAMEPYACQRDRLCTIPGIATTNAEVILAEIGVDMSVFPNPAHLASWAGVCPGNNESAGKHFSGRTRPGNSWLRAALVQAAWSASHTRDTYLAAQFWNITRRRGKARALLAVGHSILHIAYHVIREDMDYQELGGDYFIRRVDPQRETRRLVARLEALGHTVELAAATY